MSRDILTIVADLRRCERSYRAGTMSRHDYAISRGWAWGRAKAIDITTEVAEAYLTLPAEATAEIEAEHDAEDAALPDDGGECACRECRRAASEIGGEL